MNGDIGRFDQFQNTLKLEMKHKEPVGHVSTDHFSRESGDTDLRVTTLV